VASIEKRNGKYRVRFRTRSAVRGPRRSSARPTPTASPARSRSTRTAARGSTRASRRSPPQTWCETILTSSLSLAPTSLATYRRDLELYVLPALGDRRLSRLNAEQIEQWLGTELARGISPSSVHRHYRTMRRVLQSAVEKDRLLVIPCAKVRPPRVPTRPMAILTWAQSVALAEAHPAHLKPPLQHSSFRPTPGRRRSPPQA